MIIWMHSERLLNTVWESLLANDIRLVWFQNDSFETFALDHDVSSHKLILTEIRQPRCRDPKTTR